MGFLLSLLIFGAPTLLVCALYYFLSSAPARMRAAMLAVLIATWSVAIWFIFSQSQQTDDVGIMVEGILAMATTIAALVASLAALLFIRKVF